MAIPDAPHALRAVAGLVRDALTEMGDVLSEALHAHREPPPPIRKLPTVVVAAPAPFATTSYSRMRLIRALHASGLLTADAPDAPG